MSLINTRSDNSKQAKVDSTRKRKRPETSKDCIKINTEPASKRPRLCENKSMLEASRERFSKFSSSQNLLISCRPSSLKRRRVSSGQDLARTLTPASKDSISMASKLEVDRYANLQPSMKIDYSRLILQAMRERAADTTISN